MIKYYLYLIFIELYALNFTETRKKSWRLTKFNIQIKKDSNF